MVLQKVSENIKRLVRIIFRIKFLMTGAGTKPQCHLRHLRGIKCSLISNSTRDDLIFCIKVIGINQHWAFSFLKISNGTANG